VSKKIGVLCVGLGVFLLVLGAMSRWYAYDRLAVAPLDQNTTAEAAPEADAPEDAPRKRSESFGPNATYLKVTKDGASIETGDLVSVRTVVGDVEASQDASEELGQDIAIWETYTYTNPLDDRAYTVAKPLSGRIDRVAFDRRTGEAVDCCDTTTKSGMLPNGRPRPAEEMVFEGQYFKLPFNTQQQDYLFWDGTLRTATPLVFEEEEEIEGLTTYRFKQTIEPTDVDELTTAEGEEFTQVPGSLVGRPRAASVRTDRMYSNTRTLWIEPETGVIVKAEEDQLTTLDIDGEPAATITDVVISYDDQTVAANADTYSSLATQLRLIRWIVPVVGLVLGLLLVGLGVLLMRRDSSASRGRRVAEA
jgi:hypothetical protein